MRINLNFETIGSICAIVTSVAALFVAWDQSTLMRAEQHASVLPIVNTEININQDKESSYIHFQLANVGIGPAFVREGNLYINDTAITDYQVFKDLLLVGSLKQSVTMESSSLIGVIGAENTKTVLKLSWERNEENDTSFRDMVRTFLEQGSELRIVTCYCSVFQRCYRGGVSIDSTGPEEVASCKVQQIDPISNIIGKAQKSSKG